MSFNQEKTGRIEKGGTSGGGKFRPQAHLGFREPPAQKDIRLYFEFGSVGGCRRLLLTCSRGTRGGVSKGGTQELVRGKV